MPELELSSSYLRELPTRLLAIAGVQANAASRAALAAHDATHFDFAILVTLETWDDLSQAELGRRTGINRKDVAETVAGLERRGTVTRRADPDNARLKLVSLSAKGRIWIERLKVSVDQAQAVFTENLSHDDVKALVSLLQRLLSTPE